MNGKGSNPRPIDKDKYDSNFEKIFGIKPLTSLNQQNEDESKRPKKTTKKLRR